MINVRKKLENLALDLQTLHGTMVNFSAFNIMKIKGKLKKKKKQSVLFLLSPSLIKEGNTQNHSQRIYM